MAGPGPAAVDGERREAPYRTRRTGRRRSLRTRKTRYPNRDRNPLKHRSKRLEDIAAFNPRGRAPAMLTPSPVPDAEDRSPGAGTRSLPRRRRNALRRAWAAGSAPLSRRGQRGRRTRGPRQSRGDPSGAAYASSRDSGCAVPHRPASCTACFGTPCKRTCAALGEDARSAPSRSPHSATRSGRPDTSISPPQPKSPLYRTCTAVRSRRRASRARGAKGGPFVASHGFPGLA